MESFFRQTTLREQASAGVSTAKREKRGARRKETERERENRIE